MQIKKITLCPNVTFDFFHFQTADSSNANIFVPNYKPVVSTTSVSLICFDDTMQNLYDSYGTTNTALGYTFSIYKLEGESKVLDYVATLSSGGLSIVDHNVKNNTTYQYYIYKEDDDYISEANITNVVRTNWDTWSIASFVKIDESNGKEIYQVVDDIFILNLNLESGDTSQVFNKTVYDNLTQYPKISVGQNNYSKGSLNAILGTIQDNTYQEYSGGMVGWNWFCGNGRLKILKDRKGNVWIVDIQDTSNKVADESREQYHTVSFNWVEVMSRNQISVIE